MGLTRCNTSQRLWGCLDTDPLRRRPGCAACGTRRWFRRTAPRGRSTPPPAGSGRSPGPRPRRGPAAAAPGHRRQTCRGSARRTCRGQSRAECWQTGGIHTGNVLFNSEAPAQEVCDIVEKFHLKAPCWFSIRAELADAGSQRPSRQKCSTRRLQ